MNRIGKRIKTILNQKGIPQKLLASKIEMSPSKLNLILNGKRRLTVDELEKICYTLGVDYDDILMKQSPRRKEA